MQLNGKACLLPEDVFDDVSGEEEFDVGDGLTGEGGNGAVNGGDGVDLVGRKEFEDGFHKERYY